MQIRTNTPNMQIGAASAKVVPMRTLKVSVLCHRPIDIAISEQNDIRTLKQNVCNVLSLKKENLCLIGNDGFSGKELLKDQTKIGSLSSNQITGVIKGHDFTENNESPI